MHMKRNCALSSGLKRIVLTLIAVPVLLIGLLLAHVVSQQESLGSDPVATATVIDGSVAQGLPAAPLCADGCATHPVVDAASCVLALLAGLLGLAIAAQLDLTRVGRPRVWSRAIYQPLQSAIPLFRVLSISRT